LTKGNPANTIRPELGAASHPFFVTLGKTTFHHRKQCFNAGSALALTLVPEATTSKAICREESRMTKVQRGILFLLALVFAVPTANALTPSNVVNVDCNQGQSLNQALAKLDKQTPTTVLVNGTCTESVQVVGFENLTLKGLPGAALVQPSASGSGALAILSSRSVLVIGFSVQATTTVSAMEIGHGSSDIRLRELNITGGNQGITVFENSQVSIAYVTAQAPGYSTLGIYDASDVHLERSKFEAAPGASWNVGIALGASHITMYDVTITNMQVGIAAYTGSIVDMWYFSSYYKQGNSTDITILNPAGTSFNGVQVDAGGSLNVGARLVISKPGQSWGGTSGGVLLSNGSTMSATSENLLITGSIGQGVIAMNNSHATISGTIQGSAHGGLVATNLSSIDVAANSSLSTVGGNSVDLFCDTNSWITGTANIAGTPKAQCTNLLTTETAALP
jgi:hypothetical protein